MSDIDRLEARIQAMEDIEAIKRLKARYFHSIDRKRWDTLAECFTENAVWESVRRQVRLDGVAGIVAFIRGIEGGEDIVNTHQGHDPEIEILGAAAAKGVWELLHYRYDRGKEAGLASAAFYEDDYVKADGVWKIRHCRIIPIYLSEAEAASENPRGLSRSG